MLTRIPVADIFSNPDQPRKHFGETELDELAASIRMNGLLQPITVRRADDGRWMIVAGERRWRAHQRLAETDDRFRTIPCIVSEVDDAQLGIDAIIENDQRQDISIIEQARAYHRMIEDHGFTPDSLADKIGKPPHHVDARLKLLNLREEYQALAGSGQLYLTQAQYLASLSPTGQDVLFRKIQQGMCRTVTALRDIAEAIRASEAQSALFAAEQLPAPTASETVAARGFEAKVEAIAAMLRAGIDENVVTAVSKVDPGRAQTLAELFAQMQSDMHRIEAALRVAAVQQELVAERKAA